MTCNLLQLIRHPISCTAFLLALAGCGPLIDPDTALSAAVEGKRQSNDLQARAISAALCDMSLGGLDQLTQDLAWLAIEQCTDLERRVIVEQLVVGDE